MTTTTACQVIREPIGRAWRDELVTLPRPDVPARVVDGSGREWPSQLAADALWTRVDLAADQRLELRVEPTAPQPIANPVTIDQEPSVITIGNGVIAVGVPVSAAHEPGELPGPVMWLRRQSAAVGQGTWGPVACLSRVETTITDRGPLFARWVTRYIVGGREWARYECRLFAGEDFVHVSDTTRGETGVTFRFHISEPTEWFSHGGGEMITVNRRALDMAPDQYGAARAGEFAHIDFHSSHLHMSHSWMGFVAAGHAVGVSEWNGGRWKQPGRNRIHLRRAAGGIDIELAVNGGSKEFIVACGDPAAYAPAAGLSRFCHLRRKYCDLPLEKVRHWVTDWPLATFARPILYPKDTAERHAEKLAAWPELATAYRETPETDSTTWLVKYLQTGEATWREKLIEQTDKILNIALDHALDNGYLRLIIFDGRTLKVALEVIDLLRARGDLDAATARSFARRAAFIAYCMADRNFWPWDSAFVGRDHPQWMGDEYCREIGASIGPPNFWTEYYTTFVLAGLAYPEHPAAAEWIRLGADLFQRNLDYWFYESGAYAESVNYHAHEVSMLMQVAIGLLAGGHRDFFDEPRFKRTFGFFLESLTPLCRLTEGGHKLLAASHTLNPPRNERAVMITNWGNSGYDCSGYLVPVTLPIAAGIYAERDPDYARRLMLGWRLSPQEFANPLVPFALVALGRPDLPDGDLNLASKLVEGLGATMRSREVFGWVKCSTATHHNCRDEGGLVLYAHGAPVIGDFGYHAEHQGRHEGTFDTWKHTCVTFNGKTTSAYLGTEIHLPPEFWESTPAYDLLVAYTPVEVLIPEGHHYLNVVPVPRIEHRRYLLFLKPSCFVIYDHIPQSAKPSTWWIHALADAVELTPQRARFHGRYGVDLDVQVVLPSNAVITQGEYSRQRHIRIDQGGAGDYLTVITPLAGEMQPPEIRYDATRNEIRLAGRRVQFDVARRRAIVGDA